MKQISQIGVIGMSVMGSNLALNIADKGFSVSVFNRTFSRSKLAKQRAEEEGKGKFQFECFETMEEFVASLKIPRTVLMLVKAGKPVDSTLEKLLTFFKKGDIIIDGGNEWFQNTEKRMELVHKRGILYLGMGVSGGEKGARYGPSLMPGGDLKAYKHVEPILTKISAQVDSTPCVTFIGKGSSGNYVKMVHNGIEYGDMQLICESYDIMKNLFCMDNLEISKTLELWNSSDELDSYLIEITMKIFKRKDRKTEGKDFLIDKILDESGSKGTGKWTVQSAADMWVGVPTISSALDARYISGFKKQRVKASKILSGPSPVNSERTKPENLKELLSDLKNALFCSKICSYAQGMSLLVEASKRMSWDIRLSEIALIWRGGCIIRAKMLNEIYKAFSKEGEKMNLLLYDFFSKHIERGQKSWRKIICMAIVNGMAVPALCSSLSYYDSFRREKSVANLIQAQRDFFGSHKFQRNDEDGGLYHHEEWE